VIDVTPRGFVVAEMIAGMTLEQLQTMTGATLHMPEA
jgi:3-oxoadipate CoA-transferase beta subunit